jgi:hypothetical protein
MNIMNTIQEPYKTKILEILNSKLSKDDILSKLKLYVLTNAYFKELYSEPTWLVYELVRTKLK